MPSTSLVLFLFAPQVVTVLYPEVFRSSLYLSWAPQSYLQPPLPVARCRRFRRQGAERCWQGSRAALAVRWLCRPGVCLIPPACLDKEVSMVPEHHILLRLAASDGLFSPVTPAEPEERQSRSSFQQDRSGFCIALHWLTTSLRTSSGKLNTVQVSNFWWCVAPGCQGALGVPLFPKGCPQADAAAGLGRAESPELRCPPVCASCPGGSCCHRRACGWAGVCRRRAMASVHSGVHETCLLPGVVGSRGTLSVVSSVHTRSVCVIFSYCCG